MKKFVILFVLMGFLFSTKAQNAIYQVKSAKITYRYEVENAVTDYTLIFSDYGKKAAMDFDIKVEGVTEKSRTISTPEFMYLINYNQKQATKIPVGMINESDVEEDEDQLDINQLAAEIKEKGGIKIGSETVTGKQCDIYEFSAQAGQTGKFWIWNGLLMKADFVEEGHHAFIEVVDIKIDIKIEESEFEIPAGFNVTDMSDAMKQMQQMQQMYGTPEDE